MQFRDITIVNVDGRRGDLLHTQYALAHSARELPGARALLLSPERPTQLLDGITHVEIQPLGYLEYNLFVVYALHRFISTEFALIVQDDGWVLAGSAWQDSYTNYDYIGAPAHFARVTDHSGARYTQRFDWVDCLQQSSTRVEIVMNGGFSLRSRKLLQTPTQLGLPYILPPSSGLSGPPYQMAWELGSHLEDSQLCIAMRSSLESAGVRFAPLEVARQFAFEHLHPKLHAGLNLMQVFGHHSRLRKLTSLSPPTLSYQATIEELCAILGENHIGEVFRERGYRIQVR